MRLLLLMLGISVCVIGIGTSAEAQNYPWCAYYSGKGGTNCGFITFEQCMETARGLGRCSPSRAASADKYSKALSLLAYGLRTKSGSLAMFAAIRPRLMAPASFKICGNN